MKTERQKLIKENDDLFSKIIRLKDGRCQKCGKKEGLQCSHWHGRQNMIVRYDEKNADALCAGCHNYWWHGNKTETVARKEWEQRFPSRAKYLFNKLRNIPLSFQADTFWLKKMNIILKERIKNFDLTE